MNYFHHRILLIDATPVCKMSSVVTELYIKKGPRAIPSEFVQFTLYARRPFPAHFCDQTHKTPIEDHVHASAPSKERNRSKSLGPFGQPAYFTNEGLVFPKFTILYSDGRMFTILNPFVGMEGVGLGGI